MEPFLATRKEKKFGLEDGSVVFVRVLFPVLLQSRKIPPKELLLFSVQSPVKNALSLKETRSMLPVYRLPSLFPLLAYKDRGWDSGKEEDDDVERVMSLYKKDGVDGVFSFAFSSSALLRAYHVWWHFDWCFSSSSLLLGLFNQYFCVFYFVPYLIMVILVFPLF